MGIGIDIGGNMQDLEKVVKIFNEKGNFLCNGLLLNINNRTIMMKGSNLPELETGRKIIVEIYDLNGISPYLCEVGLSSINQLNALIKKKEPVTERRKTLKVQTHLSFPPSSIYRDDEDVTEHFKDLQIDMLNLSVGGMLISANHELLVGDLIIFHFSHEGNSIIINARVVRIDKKHDIITKERYAVNYGCIFEKMPSNNESVILKYLFDRQLQLYRKE